VQSVLRLAIQAANEQPTHLGRDGRGQRSPIDIRAQHGGEHVGDRVTFEQPLAGEHLVEHDPEGPDVGAFVDRLALGLFGRHVGGGADDHAHLCRARRKGW
jgi:hypothetical protein